MAKTFWDKREHGNWGRLVAEVCFLAFLLLFPLRHVTWGLDLWDTGYNYGNFTYADPKHMGSMWWFSTYLANLLGHLMTMLPFGNTLVGLNVYTGLLAGGISILGYFFCTRTLKFPAGITFAGEVLALCMCWCPTAKLYDYLTYLFFLLCCILLYRGLTEEKKGFLVLAGICLGCNLFVRFSNLPEAGMILAVWAFAFLDSRGRFWKRAAADTLWCLAGYLIPLALGFGWIAARYGLAEYGSGIRLLFAMTETATDYRASSMLYGLIWPFREGIYWVIRILVFVLGASLPVFVTDLFLLILPGKRKGKRGNPEKAVFRDRRCGSGGHYRVDGLLALYEKRAELYLLLLSQLRSDFLAGRPVFDDSPGNLHPGDLQKGEYQGRKASGGDADPGDFSHLPGQQ